MDGAEPKRINGKYAPGYSGNPGGQPHQSREVIEALRTASPALVRKAIEMALEGDATVMVALLGRVLPRGRLIGLPSSLPGTPGESLEAVLTAATTGLITPDEAAQLASLINIRAQIAELPALQERLARLEALLTGKPSMVIDAALELDKP